MLEKYKEHFTEARWNELCELVKTKGMKVTSKDFTVSEIEFIISETPLSNVERDGAIRFYVKHMSLDSISNIVSYSYSTVKYHKKRISKSLRETCCRIFK